MGEIVVKLEPGETLGPATGGASGGADEADECGAGAASASEPGMGVIEVGADMDGADDTTAAAWVDATEAEEAGAEEGRDWAVAGAAACSPSLAN